MNNHLGKFIKSARAERNLSLRQLAANTGISHSYLHVLENGIDPRTGNPPSVTLAALKKIASGLGLPLTSLIYASQECCQGAILPVEVSQPSPGTMLPMKGDNIVLVPIVGKLSPDVSSWQENEVVGHCPLDIVAHGISSDETNNYFYMPVKDNSMAPLICEQDMVLVRQGPVKEGEIGAVVCDDNEGCIKKIHFMQDEQMVMLISRNSKFDPITRPVSKCRVLGKVVLRMGEPRW